MAPTSRSVLIYGESGTGKELVARRVHEKSKRAAGPFVAVNCAAIARDLLESELFGHERGAFTGAHQAKAGVFEQAHGGTLFLDEVGDMALEHQTKVLRALQEGEVIRVGASQLRRVDVRIVAATNRDLSAAVAERKLRGDLLYRLVGYQVRLPPLRERGDDVLVLAKVILAREYSAAYFSEGAREFLRRYSWPGNIRELEDVVGAAAIDARGGEVTEKELEANLVLGGLTENAGGGGGERATTASPAGPSGAGGPAVEAKAPREPNHQGEREEEPEPERPPEARKPSDTRLDAVLAFLDAQGQITNAIARELLQLQRCQTNRLLKSWERRGKIVGQGSGRGVHYVSPGAGAAASADTRGEGGEGERQRALEAGVAAALAPTTAPVRLQVALRIAAEVGRVTRAEYAKTAKVSQRTAKRDLAELVRLGQLRAEGRGKRRVYLPAPAEARF